MIRADATGTQGGYTLPAFIGENGYSGIMRGCLITPLFRPHTGGVAGSIPAPPTTSASGAPGKGKKPIRLDGPFSDGSLALTYFRAVYLALSSALPRFTVLFGMGRSGSRALWAPDIACRPVVFQQRNQFEKKRVEIAKA